MRVVVIGLLLAVAQDPGATTPSPCDLARIEDGLYCAKCSKILRKTEKASDFDKDGNCKNCAAAPEKVKVCVKEWVPACGMHDMGSHERGCCASKFCCKVEQAHSLVLWQCPGCKKWGRSLDKIDHACVVLSPLPGMRCEASGTAPHGAGCDLKTVEMGPYCSDPGCRKLLEKSDMTRDVLCTTCRKKPEVVKVCAKTADGKVHRARIVVSCRACKVEGKEGDSCSRKGCAWNGKLLEPVCTDSGRWPHGGTPPKREK